MKPARAPLVNGLFAACMAAIAVAGAAEELKHPQAVWLPLAAMACAGALFPPGRTRAWAPELCAMAMVFCVLSAGKLAVAIRDIPGVGNAALRPAVVPVLALGAAALITRPGFRGTTALWRCTFVWAAAAVTAGLCAGFLLISRQHDLEVSTFREAVFNVALAVAAYLTAGQFLGRPGEERFGSLLVGTTAFSMLAAGLAGRFM